MLLLDQSKSGLIFNSGLRPKSAVSSNGIQ
jgi:hypothetical protein